MPRAIERRSTSGSSAHLARVHAQDLLAALEVGIADGHLPIEPAGTQQRRIEDVGAVGRRDDDDAVGLREAVHLDEQLVERLLALLVAQRIAAAAAADGVELVDEDDARRMAPRLLEQLAHARRADAGIHLDEVGAARRNERHARFSRHRARQQRLAGSRRPDEQDAARDAAADRGEAARLLQEVDDLLHLVLRLVHARDVLERDGDCLRIDRAGLLERRHAAGHDPEERQTGKAEEEQAQREGAEAADARQA